MSDIEKDRVLSSFSRFRVYPESVKDSKQLILGNLSSSGEQSYHRLMLLTNMDRESFNENIKDLIKEHRILSKSVQGSKSDATSQEFSLMSFRIA